MEAMPPPLHAFEDFVAGIANDLGVSADGLEPEARLVDDLGFDSLEVLCCLHVAAALGGQVPSALVTPDLTIRQLYEAYVSAYIDGHQGDVLADPSRVPSGERVYLRPMTAGDTDFALAVASNRSQGLGVLAAGRVPGPHEVVSALWAQVHAQFVVLEAASDAPVGMVRLYSVDAANQHGFVAGAFRQDLRGLGWPMLAFSSLLAFAFEVVGLRKVQAEIEPDEWDMLASGADRFFSVDGVLRGHRAGGGDVHLVTIWGSQWRKWRP